MRYIVCGGSDSRTEPLKEELVPWRAGRSNHLDESVIRARSNEIGAVVQERHSIDIIVMASYSQRRLHVMPTPVSLPLTGPPSWVACTLMQAYFECCALNNAGNKHASKGHGFLLGSEHSNAASTR